MLSVTQVDGLQQGCRLRFANADRGGWAQFSRRAIAASGQTNGLDRPRAQNLAQVNAHASGSHQTSPHPASAKTLLLIDNVRMMRECLSHLLQSQLPEFEIVSFAHLNDAGDLRALRPDAVLMNVHSARIDDGAIKNDISAIVAATHRAPVLVLSENAEAREALQAAETGLAGVFPYDCGALLLVAAIHLVVAGGQFYAPTISRTQMRQQRVGKEGTYV